MRGKTRFCEICGVRESLRGGFFASFPIDELRCKTWVRQVGKQDLVHIPIEKLHEIRHVCGDHFEKRDFGKTGKRLKKRAYPKLHLTAPPLSDEQLREFPQHVASKAVSAVNPAAPVEIPQIQSTPLEPIPSTSRGPLSTSNIQNFNVSAANPVAPAEISPIQPTPLEPIPSTSSGPLATSIIQNFNESIATNRTGSTQLPGSSGVSTIDRKSQKPTQSNQKTDCSITKIALIKQLQEMKSTIRSLKKNAKLMENLESPFLKEIVTLALKNRKRKPRGHRWSNKYKISCLGILKRSPKAYRYLQHLVPVPSIRTLQNILQKIPMEPGISSKILEHLRKAACHQNDKYCCLLFDEMAIKPRVNYNNRRDNVDGFTDMGNQERTASLADHALVFMLQGIRKKFKQPLAFYFVKGTVSSKKLAEIIKQVIQAINETGFKVLATVCDQGPTNMGALKMLQDSSPSEDGPSVKNYFTVNDSKIFIIYDVPHLYKSLRNNFMNYGEIRMGGKIGKWEHLKLVEEKNRSLLYLSKISANHTEPKYRAKMRVKLAAQALSNTVAAVLKLLALAEQNLDKKKELNETGEIIHDLDRLFDCTNGPSGPDDVKKGRRENITEKTDHLNAWAYYRKLFGNTSFNKTNGNQAKNVRCIKGYLITLCSLRDLWREVQRLGFKYLNLRQLNQDALENLFGVLRQHSPTNRNPTVTSFVAALKTSIISGLSAPHSRGSNCQKDANLLLTDLHNLVFQADSENYTAEEERYEECGENKENQDSEFSILHIPEEHEEDEIETNLLTVEGQPIVYLSGYLAKSILKLHDCPKCRESLIKANPDDDPTFIYIKLREWWKDRSSLTYPSVNLCSYVEKCVNIFTNQVVPILHENNLSNQAVTLFMSNLNASFIKCDEHRSHIYYKMSLRLAIILIKRQCQRINNELSAQEENLADKCKKSQQYGIAR